VCHDGFQTDDHEAQEQIERDRSKSFQPGRIVRRSHSARLARPASRLRFRPTALGRSSELYGARGAATTILLWLYVTARLLTLSTFLNATLWERSARST
jgi:hypothetical protein